MNFSVTRRTKIKIPKIVWSKIKNLVLGEKYELSLALVSGKEMRRAEKLSRHKKRANVLSFSYDKNSGEILLDVPRIYQEASKLGRPVKERLTYLYIHSLLHLGGYDHRRNRDSIIMQRAERRFLAKSG
ncbi:MAG: rRNA maturation RNase YbeY [Patescibacteria group bacterium]